MTVKRFTLLFALLALLTAGVSAQDKVDDERRGKPAQGRNIFSFGFSDPMLLDSTGLDAEALRAALLDGSTIAELIEANGGDVAAVIASLVTQITEEIEAAAEDRAESIEDSITEAFNSDLTEKQRRWRRGRPSPRGIPGVQGMNDTVLGATGLDAAGLRAALAEGSTIAELIEANGGDVAAVIASLVTKVTEEIEAATTARAESLEESMTEAFNSNLADKQRRWRRGRPSPRGFVSLPGMNDTVLDATGLDAEALRAALAEGSTIAELIEANGGDVATVIAALVTQVTDEIEAAATARAESLEDSMTEAFNSNLAEKQRRWRRGRPGSRGFFGIWGTNGVHDSAASDASGG